MKRLALTGLALFVLLAGAFAARAQEPIRFARTPAISPDGKLVCFSYLGDLWVVDAGGGTARHLTMHEKHDFNPVFSPDGKAIAYSSNRHGQYDVFVIPVQGGRPTRLTHDSADDHATGWSPDSRRVLFASNRYVDFPSRVELFEVAAEGGQARRVSAYEGREGSYSPRGDLIAYVRGPGTWYRKGYQGSSNDDVWVCNADGTDNRRITQFDCQDNWPQWSPDGQWLYFVSDCPTDVANVVRQRIDPRRGVVPDGAPGPELVTNHTDERVRRARLSADGNWLVYERGADLWVHSIKENKGRKLNVVVHADDQRNTEQLTTYTSKATEYALSRDEKSVAFVVHGELFLMPRTGGKAKRLTETPAFDHGVAWAPDGKRLLFLSDRSGHEDVYALESDDKDQPLLAKANRFKVKQLTNTPEAEFGLSFAPDGSKVAFLRAGKLVTMKPDGTGEKVVMPQGQVIDYDWSPDAKWLVYARMDGSFASELYIMPADGPTAQDPPRNVTRFATYNSGVTWSRTGNKLAFISQRRQNAPSAYVLSLQKPAVAGAPASKEIDWDDIHRRVKQPTSKIISECAISGDGSRIAFRASDGGQDDLWVANADGSQTTRVTTGGVKPTQIQWSRLFSSQLYFRDGNGNLRTVMVGSTSNAGPTTIPFKARMTVRRDELYLQMFDQGWRALRESFYDPGFHGADWYQVRDKYRALVKHCAAKEDLYALVSLMLGELNASHLGINGKLGEPEQETADLGLVFDRTYAGPGLKVAEVVRNGPADRRGLKLQPGDIIVAVDGDELDAKTDVSRLLNDKVGETVTLTLSSNPADLRNRRTVEVVGAKRSAVTALMYERWVRHNAERVTELSKGKLGYIHIPSMDEAGLERFVRALYSDNFDKEGIVLDVRFNGGGFTHDQVLNYLVGKEHTVFSQREGPHGLVLRSYDRKWTKPLTLLINNRSYSDAEIFPHAFRTWGLGKLVGQATGGHVIGTRNIQLIDGSLFRTPRIGVTTVQGVNMEKEGVKPDVAVDVHPDQLARGQDAQLDRAVQVLLQDVQTWQKTRPPVAGNPPPRGPSDSPTGTPAPGTDPAPSPRNKE